MTRNRRNSGDAEIDVAMALALKRRGYSFREIADQMGTTFSKVYNAIGAQQIDSGETNTVPQYWIERGFDDAVAKTMAASAARQNFSRGGVQRDDRAINRG